MIHREHNRRSLERICGIVLTVLFFLILKPGPARAFTLKLGVNNPDTGQPMTITLPDDPGGALDAMLGRTAGEVSVATDRLIMNASGCLKETDGAPITPAVVFLGKFGLPPSIVYGTTAVEGGLPPALFTNIIGAGVVPAPVPVHLEPGCYWIPIPVDFLDALLELQNLPRSLAADTTADRRAADNNGLALFWILPLRPGYTFQPAAWEVTFMMNSSYQLRPINDISQIDGIRNLPGLAEELLQNQ